MSQDLLFDLPPSSGRKTPRFAGLRHPLWTENKAKLVAEYLRLFVQITKHGCYIDGFAGPKQAALPDTWAAELVLRHEPRFLTDFFLCDISFAKIGALSSLKNQH